MLPPALHRLQGTLVSFVTACDHFVQVPVLRLYDLISGISMMREITGSAQLFTCHGLHRSHFSSCWLGLARRGDDARVLRNARRPVGCDFDPARWSLLKSQVRSG